MADNTNVDPRRTFIISRVNQKDTRIEVLLRSKLHGLGFRFRKNYTRLPGSPDIVLPRYKVAVFVNGCFWHGHDKCKKGERPRTRSDHWVPKIEDNKQRDLRMIHELKGMGWRVAVVWQCSLDCSERTETTTRRLASWIIRNDSPSIVVEL